MHAFPTLLVLCVLVSSKHYFAKLQLRKLDCQVTRSYVFMHVHLMNAWLRRHCPSIVAWFDDLVDMHLDRFFTFVHIW